jgi:hypothetical protein
VADAVCQETAAAMMTAGTMPKPGLPYDAQGALVLLQEYTDRFFPGARLDLPIFRATETGTVDGFAVWWEGGLSIFSVDATGAENGSQWVLQMCAVLAVNVSDVMRALLWVNDRNRRSTIDRYYCAINPDGTRCAVAADTAVSSVLLTDFLTPPNRPIMNLLRSLARNTMYSASAEPEGLLKECAGRRLTTSEPDLMTLFVTAST